MKTKTKWMASLAALCSMASAPLAAGDQQTEPSFYTAGIFFDGGGVVRTTDFDEESTALRFGLGGYLTENLGARVRVLSPDTDGGLIDEVDLNLLFRIPYRDRVAFVGYVVGGYQFEAKSPAFSPDPPIGVEIKMPSPADLRDDDEFYVGVGGEADIRLFFSPVSLVPGLEWRKVLDSNYDHELIASASLRVKF